MVEVAVVMKIVQNLFQEWNGSKSKLSIGMVSPYAAQVAAIQEKLGKKYEKLDDFSVRVKSIDGFQGGEEDIIIISTVRSNCGGSIGFLCSPQRTNDALTRAKRCLWILGKETTLVNRKSVWAELVRDAKDRKCFFDTNEDKDLAKAILHVKRELDQLDDLFKGDRIFFKSERWKVLFSDDFRKTFRSLKSIETKKKVIDVLLRLSSGWRPRKRNVDTVCKGSSQLVKQFKVEGLYLICTIDITKQSMYTQVLKVWDILPLEEIPKLIKRLDNIFGMCTNDFLNHCKEKRIEGMPHYPCYYQSDEIIIIIYDKILNLVSFSCFEFSEI